jgi:hypothetical protein
MSRQTFQAPGMQPSSGQPAANQDVRDLFVRVGLRPTGAIVPDLSALEPGDVLLFAASGVGASQITDYQRTCGHGSDDAAFVHAAVFIGTDRIAHARPSIPGFRSGGVRVGSLLSYWTHQQLAILRASSMDIDNRRRVALAAAAQADLPYDLSAIGAAARYYARHRTNLPPGWLNLLTQETQPNTTNEALPTASTCAQLVFEAFGAVDPQLLRIPGRGPIATPADLAADRRILSDVAPPAVTF